MVTIDKNENIFTSVVNRYTVARLVKEEKSSDKEEIKKVDTAEALRAVETMKIWKLQKGNSQYLQALDRITREITQHKISTAHLTTIHRDFKLK
jgi:hypothetical protein